MSKDSYNSIRYNSEGIYKDKGSKFFAYAFPVNSEETIKTHLSEIKKKFHDARHHCYAYKIGVAEDKYRINDDGEPSGTAGKPIYGQILSHDLSDILIVVVRYFGGTLLGTSGLINAYKSASIDCINNADIVEKVIKKPLTIKYSYELMSAVMRIVKEEKIDIVKQNFTENCELSLNVRLNEYNRVFKKYKDIYGVTVEG